MNHFFDVGAHNGSTFDRYIVANVVKGDRVWCFEPSPECWPSLLATIAKHEEQYNITMLPFALSGKWGVHRLYRRVDSEGNSVFPYAVGFNGVPAVPIDEDHEIKVATVPVVDFILAHTQVADTITLKLDCEGSESDILNALLDNAEALKRCEKIMVEWHIGQEMENVRLHREFAARGHPLEPWTL